jgi:hypothetical protein
VKKNEREMRLHERLLAHVTNSWPEEMEVGVAKARMRKLK